MELNKLKINFIKPTYADADGEDTKPEGAGGGELIPVRQKSEWKDE